MRFSRHIKVIKWNEQRLAIAISRCQAGSTSDLYVFIFESVLFHTDGGSVAHGVGLSASLHSSAAAVRQQLSDTHLIPYHQQNHHHRSHHSHPKDYMTVRRWRWWWFACYSFDWEGFWLLVLVIVSWLKRSQEGELHLESLMLMNIPIYEERYKFVARHLIEVQVPTPAHESRLESWSFHYGKATNTW